MEACRSFSCSFEFIDARFETKDPSRLMRRPADHILQALDDNQHWFKDKNKKLAARQRLQVFIRRLSFCARFFRHGRALLNSSYAAFDGAHQLHCGRDLVMVSEEMFNDASERVRRIQTGYWKPITNPSWFAFSGAECFTSDAAVRVLKDQKIWRVSGPEGGWGVQIFGLTAGAAWTASTRQMLASKRMSVSPMRLLTTAADVVLLGKYGRIPDMRRIVLRCGKNSACSVCTTEAASVKCVFDADFQNV